MTTQIDKAFESWIDAGIIDREWLDNPCPIEHTSPQQPRTAVLAQWLMVVSVCAIWGATVALVAYVAMKSGAI
jgi:hypothetical protein